MRNASISSLEVLRLSFGFWICGSYLSIGSESKVVSPSLLRNFYCVSGTLHGRLGGVPVPLQNHYIVGRRSPDSDSTYPIHSHYQGTRHKAWLDRSASLHVVPANHINLWSKTMAYILGLSY